MTAGFLFSAVAAAATTFGAINKYVYTRLEAKQLERKIDDIKQNYREDIREVRDKLDMILSAVKRR